ncbi:MAG: methylamine utilization protein [Pacificimonas sp.]
MKPFFRLLVAALSGLTAVPALAADFSATIVDARGDPVPNAVLMIDPVGAAKPARIDFPWQYQVAQNDFRFEPGVLIVPEGATVAFPNLDRVRHHVYSFSTPNDFELKLYGREDDRGQRFDHKGTVAMGCNIHDDMTGFVRVVDTPFAAKADGDGKLLIADLPTGAARVTIWHPWLNTKANELTFDVNLPTAAKRFTLRLKRP